MNRVRLIAANLLILLIFSSSWGFSSAPSMLSYIQQQAPDLNPKLLRQALARYQWALEHTQVAHQDLLTIVDFSKPSFEKRLWVINLVSGKVLMHTYTTHGRNSGSTYATTFSNRENSLQSSLGLFKTLSAYQGHYGLSLRIQGLEPGINDNAYKRAIIFHPAWYAAETFIQKYHRAGTSFGCFALAPTISKKLINLIKGGSLVYAGSVS